MFVTALGFFTLPVFATYFALRVKNLIVAAALTWLALFLCPFFAFAGACLPRWHVSLGLAAGFPVCGSISVQPGLRAPGLLPPAPQPFPADLFLLNGASSWLEKVGRALLSSRDLFPAHRCIGRGRLPYRPRLTPLLIHETGCVSSFPLAASAISFSNSAFCSSAGLKAWLAASPLHRQASCKSTTVPRPR